MFSRIDKILFALMVALLIAGVSIFAASAQEANPPQPEDEEKTCADCHEEFEMSWKDGLHAQAKENEAFNKAWLEQGSPSACLSCHVSGYDVATGTWEADGVYCTACHVDEGGDHPKTTMSVDVKGNTCGSCHTDDRFANEGWHESTHFASGMDCTNCHDPHSASLKLTTNLKEQTSEDASQLCISCHEEANANFPHSTHAQSGVTCVDCHLEDTTEEEAAHQVLDHSFKASIQNCSACHAEQMHTDGVVAVVEQTVVPVEPTTTHEPAVAISDGSSASLVSTSPEPVSPLGYAGITALIGIAAGMLLAPWLERGYRLILKKSSEVRHDAK